MQRIIYITVAVLLIAAGVAFYFMRPKPVVGPLSPPKDFIKASAFLAPGAQAKLPTTVRVKVWVREDLLPITSAELDPDGDRGTLPTRALDVSQWKDTGDDRVASFYFDIPWDGPESAQPVLTVHSAKGNYTTTFYVNAASLPPWE